MALYRCSNSIEISFHIQQVDININDLAGGEENVMEYGKHTPSGTIGFHLMLFLGLHP
jgi:hypothetical protein